MALTPISTMADVIRNIILLLGPAPGVGDARDPATNPNGVELLLGERYLKEEGAPPRIVFVINKDGGTLGPPLEVGARQVASIIETCRCYVWGREGVSGLDVDRYDDANARTVRLLNCIAALIPGRYEKTKIVRSQNSNIETFGEEYQIVFSYFVVVPFDDAIFAAAYALAPSTPLTPANPDQPTGPTGLTFSTTPITLTNARP